MAQIEITEKIRNGDKLNLEQKLAIVATLSLPAILSQISDIIMQYIDSAMVGSLGAEASASIGLVSSSTWLIGGVMSATAAGFSVQVAHAVGAANYTRARKLFKEGLVVTILISAILTTLCFSISGSLPQWLGASSEIWQDSSSYFRIYVLFIPVHMIYWICATMLQSTGNMKTPSILNVLCCALDVLFNFILIYPTRTMTLFGSTFHVFGFGLGVSGAALGSMLSILVAGIPMVIAATIQSPILNLRDDDSSWALVKEDLIQARNIAVPMGLEQVVLSAAQVFTTRIVAPLGTVAIAANSFAVTAEALCYMPGYGIGAAATTMVGQAIGAKQKKLAKSFAWLTTFSGMALMGTCGLVMYFLCPTVFQFLTPVAEVQQLGVSVLRIELFAEPLFAASIVATAALRGTGDTFVPAVMNLVSIWGVRVTIAFFLSQTMGLPGVWIAMATELCFRGILFLIRLKRGKWLDKIPE